MELMNHYKIVNKILSTKIDYLNFSFLKIMNFITLL